MSGTRDTGGEGNRGDTSGDTGNLRPAGGPDFGKGGLQRQPDPGRANPLPPELREPPSAFAPRPPARAKAKGAAAATLERGTVKSIHYRLSYAVQNGEAGPHGAVVLLHDLPGGAFSWDGVRPALAWRGRPG